jgi:hypothetical protein
MWSWYFTYIQEKSLQVKNKKLYFFLFVALKGLWIFDDVDGNKQEKQI